MLSKFKSMKLNKDQKGITGLETAIILIAFVVVASVFAYTVLSAGLFATQKSQESVYAGIKTAESTVVMKGDVIGTGDGTDITDLNFTLSLGSGGEAVDFTAQPNNHVLISYTDATQKVEDLTWDATWIGVGAGPMLDPGEKVQMDVTMPGAGVPVNQTFTIEIKTASGAVLTFERTTPASFGTVVTLN